MNLESLSVEDLYVFRNKYFDKVKKISKNKKDLTLKEAEIISFYNEICMELFRRGEIE